MLISLVVSAGLSALEGYLKSALPAAHLVMLVMNFAISLGLISFLFAAIYKILPDKPIAWRDVAVGAVAIALLFTIGKSLIGLYIGSSNIASSYGAAGALILIMVWVYYSAQIFLLGAEFTRAYAEKHGSHAVEAKADTKTASTRARDPQPEREPRPLSADIPAQNAVSLRGSIELSRNDSVSTGIDTQDEAGVCG